MIGNSKIYASFTKKKDFFVTFNENTKSKMAGIFRVGKDPSKHVLLVDKLHHNLISISQLCKNDHNVVFTKTKCLFIDEKHNKFF